MGRVRIGTCSGPADAALVRATFAAHDIHVVIGAEHHAGMLGGLGGTFLSLDIWVADEDAEEAIALLRDVRGEGSDDAAEHGVEEPLPESPDDDDDDEGPDMEQLVQRRRGTGLVLLLGCCITFGTAHISTGAWGRGILLAGLELLGFRTMLTNPALGATLVIGTVATDVIGALVRVRRKQPAIPPARVRKSS
jgi:hypothetical protein